MVYKRKLNLYKQHKTYSEIAKWLKKKSLDQSIIKRFQDEKSLEK